MRWSLPIPWAVSPALCRITSYNVCYTKLLRIAILGCGTVGGGVAKIVLEMADDLNVRAGKRVTLKKILELKPAEAINRFQIPANYFCGGGKALSKEEAGQYIKEILDDQDIDLVVETIRNNFV